MSALALARFGDTPPGALECIEAELRRAFGLPVAQVPPCPEPPEAYSPARGQWSSAAFLKALGPIVRGV